MLKYALLTVIVPNGRVEKIRAALQSHFGCGGTILLGHGTHRSPILRFLALDEMRREILLVILPQEQLEPALALLKTDFNLEAPKQGIAFAQELQAIVGKWRHEDTVTWPETVAEAPYYALYTLVDAQNSELALRLIEDASAGATLIDAVGTGERMDRVFNFPIESEKALLLTLVSAERYPILRDALLDSLNLDRANSGIQYAVPVHHVLGLYREEKSCK